MSGVGYNNASVAHRISVLKLEISESLMKLTEVEVAINGAPHLKSIDVGELEQKRLILMSVITRMDAQLKQLQAVLPGEMDAQRCLGN